MTGGRVCAKCGKGMGQGQAPMGMGRFLMWAKEAGVRLAAPDSRYLDPRCAARLQKEMKK